MGAGELKAIGGADTLMEADFAYNVADWEPEVNYEVGSETGELSIEQRRWRGHSLRRRRAQRVGSALPTTMCRSTSALRWGPGRARPRP